MNSRLSAELGGTGTTSAKWSQININNIKILPNKFYLQQRHKKKVTQGSGALNFAVSLGEKQNVS